MTASPEVVAAVIKKLEDTQHSERPSIFTDAEINTLKEIAATYQGFAAFGRAANVLRKILAYIGWMVAGYLAVKYAFAEMVKGFIK